MHNSALVAWGAIMRREMLIIGRHQLEWMNPLFFFVLVITLLPLAVSPSAEQLAPIAPGMIWIAALLSVMLGMDGLFRSDFEDGTLEQMVLSSQSLSWLVSAKVVAYWLVTGLPLTLISPLLGMMLSMSSENILTLFLGLLLGTLSLCLIGAIGAALTVGLRRGGVLLALLVLPLYVPILIFGAGAVTTSALTGSASGQFALMGALLALALPLAPLASAAALKISING
ncbi:heme exporter protein CcmB [Pokkaliibacter sp. CJK22405]|uniref:heme exporter protein CcmB n=1 Tax=Pokkaliibacter sp. CJK22405 TaxID=3384615 RepID=UPI0039853385